MSSSKPPTKLIRICIVEDHSDFRRTLRDAVESTGTLHCEAAFSNAEDALAYLEDSPKPDIVVLDLGLPGIDGIDAISRFRELAPDTKILILTVFENRTRVFQALGAGAYGYLVKSSGLNTITQGIEDAFHGIAPLSAEIAQMVFSTFSAFKPISHEVEISEREQEVLQALANGATRIEIACSLEVSPHTIDSHVRNIYRKLQVHNVSGAITKAVAMQLI